MKTMTILLGLSMFLAAPAFGAEKSAKTVHSCSPNNGTDLPIKKGTEIQVKAYDERTDTFVVFSVKFPGEGDSIVTLDGLASAAGKVSANRNDIAKKPDDIVDSRYVLEKDLPTLFERERKFRVGCAKQK